MAPKCMVSQSLRRFISSVMVSHCIGPAARGKPSMVSIVLTFQCCFSEICKPYATVSSMKFAAVPKSGIVVTVGNEWFCLGLGDQQITIVGCSMGWV